MVSNPGSAVRHVARTCIGCRRVADPEELVRVVRTAEGGLAVGRGLPGRGAWLCKASPACVDRAERRGAFARALRGAVAPAAVGRLRADLQERARMES